jgi:hypothetical protein
VSGYSSSLLKISSIFEIVPYGVSGEDFMTTLLSLSTKAPTVATRSEVELLFCCARTHIDSEIAERIRTLLQQDIGRAYLIQAAVQHGIIPLLYQSLNTTCPEAVPKANLAQLQNYFHTNAQRNLFLTNEQLKLLTLFESHSIPAISFKGPVLAVSAYGNLSLRRISDLDILVRERGYHKAKELLFDQGHRMLHDSKHEAFCLQAQMWHEEKEDRDRALFGICLFSACRIREACTLRVTDAYDVSGRILPRLRISKANTKGKLATCSIPIISDLWVLLTNILGGYFLSFFID